MLDLQKASMWKRISAFLFDFILLSILAVLLAWGLSAALGYDGYSRTVTDSYARYGEEWGVNLRISQAAYEALPEEEARKVDAAFAALNADAEALYAHRMMLNLSVVILSLALLLAYLALELAVPLRLGDGQTLGKKIFGVGLMRQEGVKVNAVTMFIRTVLGKFTIETMIPVSIALMLYWGTIGLVGPVVIGLILLTEGVVIAVTPGHGMIHDLLAQTVAVDEASQKIFDSPEELAAYKAEAAAERAKREEY